jgi:GNAT superfamily N-acetyltransferase
MMKAIDFQSEQGDSPYPQSTYLEPFDSAWLKQHGVDAHYLIMAGEQTLARASLWWRDVPTLASERLGIIGHFAASDQAAASMLISQCLAALRQHRCSLAVGPMDGNTWRRYRFVSDPGTTPPFFLEPENPPDYPGYFLTAGFTPIAQYSSARVADLTKEDGRIAQAKQRLKNEGITWRPLKMDRFEKELRAIYQLSVQSFTQNFLYTPIEEALFLAQYQLIAPYVQPELTLMAEQGGELLGYLFGIPDLNQSQRGEALDTFIVKTVAVLPTRRAAGLGSVLVAESHRIAYEGYTGAIHALMHDANNSRNISAHYAHTMRQYTLYQQRIEPPL